MRLSNTSFAFFVHIGSTILKYSGSEGIKECIRENKSCKNWENRRKFVKGNDSLQVNPIGLARILELLASFYRILSTSVLARSIFPHNRLDASSITIISWMSHVSMTPQQGH